MTGCLTRFLPPFPRFIFSFRSFGIVSHLHKFENHDIRTTRVAHREGEKNGFFCRKIVEDPRSTQTRATQLGMQMFRDRCCIVKGNEILFGRTKCKRWLDALGRFARIFPVERSIARVLSSGNGPRAKMIHVFFCGENRSVISFNLYVSLDNWQSREIKGWLMSRVDSSIRTVESQHDQSID